MQRGISGPHEKNVTWRWNKYVHSTTYVNPLNAELNPICHLLALLGTHPIFHVSGLRVKGLFSYNSIKTTKWLMGGHAGSVRDEKRKTKTAAEEPEGKKPLEKTKTKTKNQSVGGERVNWLGDGLVWTRL